MTGDHGIDGSGRSGRRGTRRTAPPVILVGVLLLGLAGCGDEGKYKPDDPRSAVNQFLLATVGQANGQRACSLLSPAAQARLAETAAGSCRQAMNTAVSSMPGAYSATEDAGRAAEKLEYTSKVDGDHAVVSAWRGKGRHLTFRLVRVGPVAKPADSDGPQPGVGTSGNSEWRIETGAEQLLKVDTPAS